MLNKKLMTAAVAAALTAGVSTAPAFAGEGVEISGNVALTTDYRFRGISQSDEDAAVQGGFDVSFEPGFYIGTWGSSVDFDTNGGGLDGSLELDYYAGWAGNIGDSDVGIDVGYIYYDYPGDDGDLEGDYQEFYVGVSWMDATLQVNYSDDYYAETDEFWYISGDYSFELVEGISLGLHVGYNMLEEGEGFLSSDEDAYTDYSVSATYSYGGADFSLAWVGTDLDDEDVFGSDWADDTAVFTISKSL
jgi:uncharacterized protein (TIGR02001 family)